MTTNPQPSALRPRDELLAEAVSWLNAQRLAGHCGEGTLERKQRERIDNYIEAVLSALSEAAERIRADGEERDGQDRKYTTATGRFVNRVSGEEIPLDEPTMVFRARDKHALDVAAHYHSLVENDKHRAFVGETVAEFDAFRRKHPNRMKEPGISGDFNLAAQPQPLEREAWRPIGEKGVNDAGDN